MIQKNDYPLSVVKNIKIVITEFKKLTFQNEDIIAKIAVTGSIIYLEYRKNKKFYFSISSPSLSGDFRSCFILGYMPQDEHSQKKASYNVDIAVLLVHFSIWMNLLREFDEINLEEADVLTKFYEDEFFKEFEILDDDAYSHPFEHQKQIILSNYLDHIETELKKQSDNDPEIKALINETVELKANIQNFTKKLVVRKLSRILAKIKKKALPLIVEILNETKKEIIKRALTGGMDDLVKYIHHPF